MVMLIMVMLISVIIITAAVCTHNSTKLCSRGILLSAKSNRVFQSDYSLRQSIVTKAECFELIPVRFAEVLAALFSDGVSV